MKTFKTCVQLLNHSEAKLHECFNVARWTYNYAVAAFFAAYAKDDHLTSWMQIQKEINNGPAVDGNHSFLDSVTSLVRQEALRDFGAASQRWTKAQQKARRTNKPIDPERFKPDFRRKKDWKPSARWGSKGNSCKIVDVRHFSLTLGTLNGKFQKPLLFKTYEDISFLASPNTRIVTCTISYSAGRYYASISYEKTNQAVAKARPGKLALDLGVKHMFAWFDGTHDGVVDVPENLLKAEQKRRALQAKLSTKKHPSKRREKVLQAVQRAYEHENNIRKDMREKITRQMAQSFDEIVIDDFSFQGVMNLKGQKLHAKAYRLAPYEFKLRLLQKCRETGCSVRFVPRATPTTQLCSCCGTRKKVGLGERIYTCEACGLVIDRDLNAAHNVFKL